MDVVFILSFFIFAFIWAYLCYSLAQKKDKNKGVAFFMGLIFGIFAVLYYGLCSEGSFKCPHCDGQIKHGVSVCKHCGRDIVWK